MPKTLIYEAKPRTSKAAKILMSDSDSDNDYGDNDINNYIYDNIGLKEWIEIFSESGSKETLKDLNKLLQNSSC